MIPFEIDAVWRPAEGEQVCGDAFVQLRTDAQVTLCVADGLGHGPLARAAADLACAHAVANPEHSADALLRGMFTALAGSRGAAVAVLTVDRQGFARFAGVGNIELRTLSAGAFAPVSVAGIVGRGTPRIIAFGHKLAPRDLLVLHTDGISSRAPLEPYRDLPVRAGAAGLLKAGRKPHDDALCVFARYDPTPGGVP